MFDSSDYLFNEFTPSLRTSEADDLMFSADTNSYQNTITSAVQQIITVENATNGVLDTEKIFHSNTYSADVTNQAVADLLVIPTESLLSFEPTLLLDDNTVNQFLLPVQETVNDQQVSSNDVPDLLSLQSCAICHEIFATEAELLDHTVGLHVSNSASTVPDDISLLADFVMPEQNAQDAGSTVAVSSGLENDWLLCDACGRVLATALEEPPIDLICCIDEEGKCNIRRQTLDTMYVCDVCSGLFGDADAMDRHKQTCNSISGTTDTTEVAENVLADALSNICFTCDLCNDQFLTAEDMKVHAEACGQAQPVHERQGRHYKNSSNKMWNCGSCNQLFVTARELYRHKRGEDRPEGAPYTAYVCEECDKVLGSMCALHTHRKMHKVTKPGYPCRICGRRFNQSGHLAIHMRMHTGERPYPCDLCSKAFKVKVERDDHRRTHTGERPFACTACPKTFTAAARLREHARIHTDQRPYTCEICGAAFRRPYARTVHTLIHTGQKPHQCDICKTAFRRSGDMWKHKRTIHGIESADEKRA